MVLNARLLKTISINIFAMQIDCTDDLYLCFVNAEGGTARYSQV